MTIAAAIIISECVRVQPKTIFQNRTTFLFIFFKESINAVAFRTLEQAITNLPHFQSE
jgi:hypothetical protein